MLSTLLLYGLHCLRHLQQPHDKLDCGRGLSSHVLSCIKLYLHYRYIPLRQIEEGNLVFELERLGEPVAGCEVLGQDPGSPGQEAGPGPEGAAGEDEVVTQGQQRQVHPRRHGGAQPGRA